MKKSEDLLKKDLGSPLMKELGQRILKNAMQGDSPKKKISSNQGSPQSNEIILDLKQNSRFMKARGSMDNAINSKMSTPMKSSSTALILRLMDKRRSAVDRRQSKLNLSMMEIAQNQNIRENEQL